jgi:hypothetical protein
MTFVQVGLAAGMSNSIVYEIMQHFINFVSVVCVAFATGVSLSTSPTHIVPFHIIIRIRYSMTLNDYTVWYSSSAFRESVKEDDHHILGNYGSPGDKGRPKAQQMPSMLRFRRSNSSPNGTELSSTTYGNSPTGPAMKEKPSKDQPSNDNSEKTRMSKEKEKERPSHMMSWQRQTTFDIKEWTRSQNSQDSTMSKDSAHEGESPRAGAAQ